MDRGVSSRSRAAPAPTCWASHLREARCSAECLRSRSWEPSTSRCRTRQRRSRRGDDSLIRERKVNTHRKFGALRFGLAASATLAFGVVSAQPAVAARPAAAFVEADTLIVQGTNASDHVAIRLAANGPNILQVDFGDDGSPDASFDRASFSHIVASLRAGDDVFRVDQANGAFADEQVIVDAGAGNDTVSGGDGADIVLGRS